MPNEDGGLHRKKTKVRSLYWSTEQRSDLITLQESDLEAFRKKSHKKFGGAHVSKAFRDFERVRKRSLDRDIRPSQQKRYVYIPSVYC